MSVSQPPRHALFPGSFDPLTLGHLDLLERSAAIFDRVTVLVASHPSKQQAFEASERVDLIREVLADLDRVGVALSDGLLVEACVELDARIIVRGVRGGGDLEYERQMADTNRAMCSGVDTVFLTPSPAFGHISSTLVRQIASMGGDVTPFVPSVVAEALRRRFPSD
jgi:pantetheine-phosphate adenylyltransferase